jgi:hypothetical protein
LEAARQVLIERAVVAALTLPKGQRMEPIKLVGFFALYLYSYQIAVQ